MSQQQTATVTSDSSVPQAKLSVELNYKTTLAQWLSRNIELSTRRKQLFGSELLHPTEFVKALIKGMINVVFDMIDSGKSHKFLLNHENYLLSDDGTTSDRDVAIEVADEYDHQCVITVTLAFTKCQNEMNDDLALKTVIKEILDVDNNSTPLPPEWVSFMGSLDDSTLNRDLLRSHPCLWNWKKRLNFFLNVEHLYNGSTFAVEEMVYRALRSLRILDPQNRESSWERVEREVPLKNVLWRDDKRVEREVPLKNVIWRDDNGNKFWYPDHPRFVIKFIRNMIVHVNERKWNRQTRIWEYKNINVSSVDQEKYTRKNYLDHKLSELFPDMIIEMHEKLLDYGFKW